MPHLKSPKNQNRRAALGRPAIKNTGGLELVCYKVLNSKSVRKVMLVPYNFLKQSEYNLPLRHISKSMTLTSVVKWNWGGIV